MYRSPDEIVDQITQWAADETNVCGLAIVGSYARNAATPESDLDVVVVCNATEKYLENIDWTDRFGPREYTRVEAYGLVTSVFVEYASGLEVEFGITSREWVKMPIDAGTARVIGDGMKIQYDPEGLLRRAERSVATIG